MIRLIDRGLWRRRWYSKARFVLDVVELLELVRRSLQDEPDDAVDAGGDGVVPVEVLPPYVEDPPDEEPPDEEPPVDEDPPVDEPPVDELPVMNEATLGPGKV